LRVVPPSGPGGFGAKLRAMPQTGRSVAARLARLSLWILAAVAAGLVVLGALWVTLPDPSPLARENPKTTALIEQRRAEATSRRRPFRPSQGWISLDRVSRRLVEAVLLSEDARFFGHDGFDWDAIREAAHQDAVRGRFVRGASTLTQQLAKNLWFGTERSLWRKAKEAVMAAKLERQLPKRRILSLYLNVVEWGAGSMEARRAAWAVVSCAAPTPKWWRAPASTPKTPSPHSTTFR
jgi:monofunctional glycosyltransferase